MRKMKLFLTYDPRTKQKHTYITLETMISVFIDNNGTLVDVKPINGDMGEGFMVIYDEYGDSY